MADVEIHNTVLIVKIGLAVILLVSYYIISGITHRTLAITAQSNTTSYQMKCVHGETINPSKRILETPYFKFGGTITTIAHHQFMIPPLKTVLTFDWCAVFDKRFLSPISQGYIPSSQYDNHALGKPGTDIFTFMSVDKGKTILKMVLMRCFGLCSQISPLENNSTIVFPVEIH
jgi:hypothetical protein